MNSDKSSVQLNETLDVLRTEIDAIDRDIVQLINKRLVVGKKIGEIKQERGAEILDQSREKKVLERLSRINEGPADEDVLRYIFSVIMTATRQIQKLNRICYLGPEASYTHIAALNHFNHSGQFVEVSSIQDIFIEVDKKECHFGIVPVENSIEGAVKHTLDLFCDYDLNIYAEHYEPISYDLLSVNGDIRRIKTIYSQPQAIGQCGGWIRKKLPGVTVIETSSTSKAASIASEDASAAAIASSRAAHIYGLQVVESKIEDHIGNVTRFLIIGRDKAQKTDRDKTSIMFATSHVPGALFKAIEPVQKAGLNMLKLESRPNKHQNWSYYFFMDIEGHISDPSVSRTIRTMEEHCLFLKMLGSYPISSDHE